MGKISLEMSNVELPKFLAQIVQMFAPQFEQKQLKFNVQISEHLPQYVRTDQKRLEQILINVLGNALKFTSQGEVTLCVEYRFQTAYFYIKDTGCGIAATDLARIFQPFERGEHISQYQYAGTGLGLPIVKLLVEVLGGELTVQSTLKQGSTFHIKLYLPSKSLIHPIAAVASHRVAGYHGQRRKILVVDNDATDRGLIVNFLSPLGFVLKEADSGLTCLRMVTQFSPDLILMDLSMPLLGGWETAKILRQNQITNVPILIISADANERMQNPETDVLNEDFLVKPVDLNHLLSKIGDKLGLAWQQHQSTSHSVALNPVFEQVTNKTALTLNLPNTQHEQSKDLMALCAALQQHLAHGYVRGVKEVLRLCHTHHLQYAALWAAIEQDMQRFDTKRALQRLANHRFESDHVTLRNSAC